MSLPDVAIGGQHVEAHNEERALINALQNVTDPDFLAALLIFVASKVESENFSPTGSWDFTGATVSGIALLDAIQGLTDPSFVAGVDAEIGQIVTEGNFSPTGSWNFSGAAVDGLQTTPEILLLENGQTAADVPAGTAVGTIVFEKGA